MNKRGLISYYIIIMVLKDLKNSVESHLSECFEEKVEIKNIETIGGGCINHASKLETNVGDFFLKWNSNCKVDLFLREAESLHELEKASSQDLIIPKVFCTKELDSTPAFLVQQYLPSNFAKNNQEEMLGRGLATIHKYTNEKFGFYTNNYCGATIQNNQFQNNWLEFFRDNRLRFLLNLIQQKSPLPNSELKVYDKLLDRIERLIPKDSIPTLIHGDLWSGNYMNTNYGGALIDPAVYYADREMEFAIITMFGGFSQTFYGAYNETNPLSHDWRSRNKLYQLYHVLNHYYLFGGLYQAEALTIARSFL